MKVLVLGGTGMLGHQVFFKLRDHFGANNVACTVRKLKPKHIALFKNSKVYEGTDFLDFNTALKTLEDYKPNWIINCVGLTLRKPEVDDTQRCLEINSMLPHRLAKWGQQNNCRVIHFSTDCVFDGKKGNYTEKDIPTATDLYGQSKFLGELTYDNTLTLRLSIVGREIEGKTELIEWFLSQRGKPVQGFSKAWYSGLTTNFVANELMRIIEKHPHLYGLYQIASEKISKYELLKLVNQIYACRIEITEKSDYAADKTLNCSEYIKATGFKKPQWAQMIQEMKNEERVNYDSF